MNPKPTLRDALREVLDLSAEEADHLANRVIEARAKRLGGERIYWPARAAHPTHEEMKERDASIRRDFNGTNLQEICQQYRISKTTVYRVVSR